MDNLAFSAETPIELDEALVKSKNIFESYGFKLQQFGTNCSTLKSESIECTDNKNLFGLSWNLSNDTYANKTTLLDAEAKTKRQVLSSINSIYDPFRLLIPLLNRVRLLLHSLQCDSNLSWDKVLDSKKLNVWKNICNQFNKSTFPSIPRYIVAYNENFNIVAYADASKEILGCVIYLQNTVTNELHFAFAKSKIFNNTMAHK